MAPKPGSVIWVAPPGAARCEVLGQQLEYRWIGPRSSDAPSIVFLHEGLGCLGMWRDFPERLASATGCGALVYSRIGYGGSDPLRGMRPVRYMHDEALEVLPAVFEPGRLSCWLAAAFVLAAYPTALASRLFHDALAAAMLSEYATRARAQGFSEGAILLREALVNALAAPVSAIANGLAYFFTGTFFVEVAFGIGGIGSLTYDAIRNKDITVLAGVCVLFAFVISAISAVLDLAQHVLSPRLRRSDEWQG